MSNNEELILHSVVNCIEKSEKESTYGHILLGLEEDLVAKLVDVVLSKFEKVFFSVVGYSQQLNQLLETKDTNMGFTAEHAVKVRNTSDINAIRIVIAAEEERKFGSLKQRGYQIIDDYVLMIELCEIAITKAENEPEVNLWKALKTPELSSYLSIKRVIDFYIGVVVDKKSPRTELIKLHLLPDKEILTGKFKNLESIKNRLIKNIELLDKVQRGDTDERSRVIDTLRINKDNEKVRDLYSLYNKLSESDFSILPELDLAELEALYSRKFIEKIDDDGNGADDDDDGDDGNGVDGDDDGDDGNGVDGDDDGDDGNGVDGDDDGDDGNGADDDDDNDSGGQRRPLEPISGSLEQVAIEIILKGDVINQKELFKKVNDIVKNDKYEKNTIKLHGEGVKYEVEFTPNISAIAWNNNFIIYDDEMSPSKSGFGGEVYFDGVLDLYEVQKNPKQYTNSAIFYDDIFMAEFKSFTDKYKKMNLGFTGDEYLEEFLSIREKLIKYKEFLSTDPLAAMILNEELRELVDNYIRVYQKLSKQLQRNYHAVKQYEGAKKFYQDFLKFDTIKFYSNTDVHIILTSLSPFALWKNLELSKLIYSRNDNLNTVDKELLLKEIKNLPEPLLTYTTTFNGNYETLAFSSRLGSMPIYSKNEIVNSDLNKKSLELSALKLASLYPYIKENLRILLVDPLSTGEVSKTLQDLLNKYGFKRITLIIAKMNTNHTNPYDANLKELSDEKKIDIEVQVFKNISSLNKYIRLKPVHILGFSGLNSKNISTVVTEKTKLHPLSLPHKIDADPFTNSVTLKPRSIDNDNELEHPFSKYHLIVGDLTNNYDIEYGYEVGNLIKEDDIKQLMSFSQFTLLSNASVDSGDQYLRLSKNLGQGSDSVYTKYESMILDRLDILLREFNYKPSKDGLKKLLYNLQNVGGEGLFSVISNKGSNGLLNSAVKGLLGTALATEWYKKNLDYNNYILISLDSYLSKIWLSKRKDQKRSDFLGIRRLSDKSYVIDIIEVKGYEATNDSTILESRPIEQLRSIANILVQMLLKKGDLFIDRRRELLRLQIFKESLQYETAPDVEWVSLINQIIDGDIKVNINLMLFEIAFDENIKFDHKKFGETGPVNWKDINTFPIDRIKLGEEQIQKFLYDYEVNREISVIEETKTNGTSSTSEGTETTNGTSSTSEGTETTNGTSSTSEGTETTNGTSSTSEGTETTNGTSSTSEGTETNGTSSTSEGTETNGTSSTSEGTETNGTSSTDEEVEEGRKATQVFGEENGKTTDVPSDNTNYNANILLGTVLNGTKEINWNHSRDIESPLSNHNIIITGDPGKGKTQSIKAIIHDMRLNRIPLILMDFKDDYIDEDFLAKEGLEIYDVMEKGLPFNPLVPPIDKLNNTFNANGHIQQLEGILDLIYGLGDIQTFKLRQAMREAFIEKGINPRRSQVIDESIEFPTFNDVFEILMRNLKDNASLIARLDLLFGLFPDQTSNTFEDLLGKSYNLRLTKLPTDEVKSAVTEILILTMHNYFSSQEHPRKLTRGIVLDEAHRVSKSEILVKFARECRAFGISLIIATQFPTDMSEEIYGCTETKLFLGNDDPKHARKAAERLVGNSNREIYLNMSETIRSFKQFNAVIRNVHYNNVIIDIKPYFKKL